LLLSPKFFVPPYLFFSGVPFIAPVSLFFYLDAASNEGRWTYPGTFNIYAPFPAWATIILAILGALFIFGLGYLARVKNVFSRKQ